MTSGRSRLTSARGDTGSVRSRLIASLILGIIALPVIFVGLIDPLEGGLALLVAVCLGVAVRLLSGVALPRLAWISMLATVGVGILVLVLVIFAVPNETVQEVGPEVTAQNPLNAGARVLLWVYRLGVLLVLAGGVVYLVRIAQALRVPGKSKSEVVDA
jgi:hypothetical protein